MKSGISKAAALLAAALAALVLVLVGLSAFITTSDQADTTNAAPAACTTGPAAGASPSNTDTQEARPASLRIPNQPVSERPGGVAALPYDLPAANGTIGAEEAVDAAGRVASTGNPIAFAKFAALGAPWRNYYITMRWRYAAWNFDGTASIVDRGEYGWLANGHGGHPWLIKVSNPRTHQSVLAAAIQAGPAPWVGVTNSGTADGAAHGWTNPTRGTPANWHGIVAGVPPTALTALGATTGYPGQHGDVLTYEWAPDQNATPGPVGASIVGSTRAATLAINCSTNGVACGTDAALSAGAVTGLTPEQSANARAIAGVPLSRGLGRAGVLLTEMTADTESDLINVGHGDQMGPSSRGLFQQMGSWGPLQVRMDPAGAAGLFLDAVQKIPGWQLQDLPSVAQQVQQSEYNGNGLPYAGNYRAKLAQATQITDQLLATTPSSSQPGPARPAAVDAGYVASSAAPAAASAGAGAGAGSGCGGSGAHPAASHGSVSGVSVTLPSGPDVDPRAAGKTITAPTEAMARGLAAGFAVVGMPYVYGGGTNGGGPDEGCARAGGQLNSCAGTVGLDCSGLTGYILAQAGFRIPDNSSAQRAGGTLVPRSQGRPGDIIGYAGHVTIYLGNIGGTDYLLEASQPGTDIHIRPVYYTNEGQPADTDFHRYWTPTFNV